MFGAGTTASGFQLNPLHAIDISSGEIFTVSASHRTPIYGTAIVENYAGLRSVFRSKKILVDHTPPGFENITVTEYKRTPETNETNLKEGTAIMRLTVKWAVLDEESGVKICFVSVG